MKAIPFLVIILMAYWANFWFGVFMTFFWGVPFMILFLTYWYCKLVVKYAEENPEVYNREPDICRRAYDDIMEQKYKKDLLIKISRS